MFCKRNLEDSSDGISSHQKLYGIKNKERDMLTVTAQRPWGEPVNFIQTNPMLTYLFYMRIHVFYSEYFNYLILMLIKMAKRKKSK